MIKLLFLLLAIILIHALYNLINFLRYNYIESLLIGNYSDDSNLFIKSRTRKNTILNYIKYSGVKDKHIPISQSIGFGQFVNGNVSLFNNLLNPRQDIAYNVFDLLLESKGNYWSKFINSFNPFYWLRIVLYIPKFLLSYLGVKADSIFTKICQLIYWFLCVAFTILTTIFTDEVKAFIMSFINPS